ncbi:MAG: ketoacyl-ACP synthase III [Pseudomonadota bacterium]
MKYAEIIGIEYYLPQKIETNQDIAEKFPDWTIEKIEAKTGIIERHIAAPTETAGDLAYLAAEKLFASGRCSKNDIGYLILCTESPDYILPPTACILQDRLQLKNSVGAFDFNLGCSGYIYGLSIAKGLIESGQANGVLLLTADTYSKYIHPEDRSVRTIFGDGATATYIRGSDLSGPAISRPQLGTDGSGFRNLIIEQGGLKSPKAIYNSKDRGQFLYMNGSEIFNFTLNAVPKLIDQALDASGKRLEDIDYFIFHQANQYMLENLRKKIGIPKEKFCIDLRYYGNTVSSTIPIALSNAISHHLVKPRDEVLLVGFGVGYSWGSIFVSLNEALQPI